MSKDKSIGKSKDIDWEVEYKLPVSQEPPPLTLNIEPVAAVGNSYTPLPDSIAQTLLDAPVMLFQLLQKYF